MEPPDGMTEVTERQFFDLLYADPRDIMPNHDNPLHTVWETKSRAVFGQTYPGWQNPGDERHYFVKSTEPHAAERPAEPGWAQDFRLPDLY